MKKRGQITSLITLVLLIATGCSSRYESPVEVDDSMVIYPAKDADGVLVKITFCRDESRKTDKRIGEGTDFTIMENENILALVDLENCFVNNNRDLMFHMDWIGANGKSFYSKRIDLSTKDSTSTIKSSISISPDRREAGEYMLRLYLFRELIAEKKFEILPEFQLTDAYGERISTEITLYRKKSKKTGKLIGKGTDFTIRKKTNLRASIALENRFAYGNRELIFHLDWVDSEGKTFYSKEIILPPDDTTTTLRGSISIAPGKRQAGDYAVQIYLFRKPIGEKKFVIHPTK